MSVNHASEIFPLSIDNYTIDCFRLNNELSQDKGNRISYHLSCELKKVLVIWNRGLFYALYQPEESRLSPTEWNNTIRRVLFGLSDLGDIYWQFEAIDNVAIAPIVLAKLATQALNKVHLNKEDVFSVNRVKVSRQAKYWSETIKLKGREYPALAITIDTKIVYRGNLKNYYDLQADKVESNFIGLQVKNLGFDNSNNGRILGFRGIVKKRRDELLTSPHIRPISRKALIEAKDNEPIVAVNFGKKSKEFHFALAALSPCINNETAPKFGANWGTLLKRTKISLSERKNKLIASQEEIASVIEKYGFKLEKSVSKNNYPQNFVKLPSLNDVELLFGNRHTGTASRILKGLKNGGVYKRHGIYQDRYRFIRIALLEVIDERDFSIPIDAINQRLDEYGFDSDTVNYCRINIAGLSDTQARIKVEKELNDFLTVPPDILIGGLPLRDRNAEDDLSLYNKIYSTVLRRQLPSQFIYEDTILKHNTQKNLNNILNQLVPGILAKLGNIPYVIKEPLTIADYYIGFDVARLEKEKTQGSMNACASIRMYGQHGEFIKYHLHDSLIPGEEIPQSSLERLLPYSELNNKIVLILRDGRFVGREVENLLNWATEIGAKFILVECTKDGVPRLYNFSQGMLQTTESGLLQKLTETSGILVTTDVKSERIGLARPLRLNIHPAGSQSSIESVADVVRKFTLLHYGSLNNTRTPMPIYASDRIGYLRLRNIYPSDFCGDTQFWL